ncbi:MAG: ArgE/DapE family deacylase [Salinisphaera sp.]|jgi:acetylornithine deacetylase|nr:ArgE/DapE family deacylase [Salinisphaera sp.]
MAIDSALEADILSAVDTCFEKQVSLTEELVRFASLRGREHTAQDFLFQQMRERGYAMDRWAIDISEIADHPGFSPVTIDYANALNVVGTHRPRDELGASLILNGHIDVVPEGPHDMWTDAPFSGKRDRDWLYGRGAGDMKAGLVANIAALDALRHLGYQPAATVHLQSVVEEECTGNGALSCLARGYRADAALIPEPEDNRLVRANTGVLWFRVKVRGAPVHVREAGQGANAIEAAYRLIQALREMETDWNTRQGEHRYFETLDHPINLNIGKIEGGDWASSVPAWCNFDVRVSIYPGTRAADAATEIEACVASAARADAFLADNPPEIEYNGFFAEGYVLEEGSDAETALASAHAKSFGADLETFTTPGYLDARVFMLYGDTPCLVYGPYSENIHGFDERVSLTSVKRITGTIALFVAHWCGLERIDSASGGR